VIGWLHEIEALNREQALAFYRIWYAPNNAIVVVAGDIDAAELRPMVERIYGRLQPTRNLPERAWTADPPATGPMRVTHRDEKVRQPSLSRLYPAISYSTDEGRQAHALDVAMDILGGSETSRLYRALVEERRLAVGAGAGANTSGRGGGSVSVYATPADGVALEELEAAVDEVIAQYLRDGPSEAELARSKSQLSAAAVYARDSQESLANIYGSSLAEGQTLDEIVTWPDSIEALTREEVMAMARQTLDIGASVTGWLLPEEAE
jgi:zinc protease